MPGTRGARAGSGSAAFAVACIVLLAAGLMSLLLINISMSRASYALHDLQATSGELADTQDALTQQLSGLESPPHLAKRAVGDGHGPGAQRRLPAPLGRQGRRRGEEGDQGRGLYRGLADAVLSEPLRTGRPGGTVTGAQDGAAAPSTTEQTPGAAGTTEPSTTR